MSTASRRRIMKDYQDMMKEPSYGIMCAPKEDNIQQWYCVICGAQNTLWEGGVFCLSMEFTDKYPAEAPLVKFLTPMFHPNVYKSGDICLDILQKSWSASYTASSLLTSIQSLLPDPNTSSPANVEAAKLWNLNRGKYNDRVLECVEASWKFHLFEWLK